MITLSYYANCYLSIMFEEFKFTWWKWDSASFTPSPSLLVVGPDFSPLGLVFKPCACRKFAIAIRSSSQWPACGNITFSWFSLLRSTIKEKFSEWRLQDKAIEVKSTTPSPSWSHWSHAGPKSIKCYVLQFRSCDRYYSHIPRDREAQHRPCV